MEPIRKVGQALRSHARAVKLAVSLMFAGLLLVGGMGAASATPADTDITGGNGDTFFTTITSYFKDHVLVSVLLLLALTVGVSMLISWGKKAAKGK
jgi:ABC-type proline/glycine betaine transport system permease subunit